MMLTTLFGKKKITSTHLADLFVSSIIDSVDKTFCDVADFINEAPEFSTSPNISANHSDRFLLIVLAANMSQISKHFSNEEEHVVKRKIVEKFADIYGVSVAEFSKHLDDTTHLLYRVKERSSNVVYAMSKALFHKYKLFAHQERYFKELNTPNPIFLRRLDQLMKNYLFCWDSFFEKYKVA